MKKYFLAQLFLIFFALSVQAQQIINIPLNFANWDKTSCGNWEQIGDTLRFYGTSSRVGGFIETQAFYDLSNADVYIKWKVNGANNYMQVGTSAGNLSQGIGLTTDHTFTGSILIDSDKWYFTHFKITPNRYYHVDISYGNYLNQGGTLVDSSSYSIDSKKWDINIKKGKIAAYFGDNYGSTNCYMEIAEVKLLNAIQIEDNSYEDISYDFENGNLPQNFITNGFNWSIADTGYNSTKSIYINSVPTENPSISLNISGAAKVSFDVMFNSGYTWNPDRPAGFIIDSIGVVSFDRSTLQCWHHFEWLLPDTLSHMIEWAIYPSTYPQNNAELWIDNITIYRNNITSIDEGKVKLLSFKLEQNYPNPFNPTTTINYSIQERSFVQLKIYDMLGNVVATLVNKEQPRGNYNIEFNASKLASGVYFYRLHSGNFLETKKLVLLK